MEDNKDILNPAAAPETDPETIPGTTAAPSPETFPGTVPETTPAADEIARLREAHEKELREVRIQGEVRYVLARMGAKNPGMAAKAVDLSAVTADENGVAGVEDAVRRLMHSDPYLFGTVPMAQSGREGSSGGIHGETRRDPETLSDREYYDMLLKR